MAFKMKGNPFNLGKVATKSGIKMAKKAMKMKTESPMRRVDYEYDGDIIDAVAYKEKMDEAKKLKDLTSGYDLDLTSPTDEDLATAKKYIPDFMTEEEFKAKNPNLRYGPYDDNPYYQYVDKMQEQIAKMAGKELQDKYAPKEGAIVGDVGSLGKLKATGQDFINQLQRQYQEDKKYRDEPMSIETYAENEGLLEQYRNALRETEANKQ